jgi:spore coat protein U-like protein
MTPTTTVDVFNSNQTVLGYINVFSNRSGNWTITITSTNAGAMRGVTAGNTDIYPYTLKFGTKADINLATPYTIEMSGKTTTDGAAYSLGVEYQNFWNLTQPVSPDTYRDTITVTIAAA